LTFGEEGPPKGTLYNYPPRDSIVGINWPLSRWRVRERATIRRTGTTRLCVISDARRRRERFGLFRDAKGLGAEVSGGNGVQEGAHVGGSLGSERLLELPLRLRPSFHSRPKTGFAGLGHP
jgi:hypothetical protein